MSTLPIYWSDPLKHQFDVTIESILEVDGTTYLQIKENVVKPTGGGQSGDRGHLIIDHKKYEFIDTILYEDRATLVMKNKPPIEGKSQLILDMEWRTSMMRNHTSEHIFVGAMKKKFPEVKLGRIWVDGDHGTIILEGKEISLDEVLEVEAVVNRLIHDAVRVTTRVVTAEDVDESVRAREGVTSKNEEIRLVNVGDFDSSACSGIHVTNTKDIRIFKIIDVKASEGDTHIEFLSGPAAVKNIIDIYNLALSKKYEYPYEIEQLGAILDKSKALQVSYEEAIEKIVQLLKEGPHKEQVGKVTFWFEYLPGCEIGTIRHVLKEMNLTEPSVTLFLTTGKKVNVILWTKGMPEDASHYISEAITDIGGKGGGSAEAFTGGFADVDNPMQVFEILVDKVRAKMLTK